MRTFLLRRVYQWSAALLVVLALTVGAGGTASASSSTQVILSGTGISTTAGPAGYWIWSQPSNPNAYGNGGNGSVYFYTLLPADHPVDASNVTVVNNTVTETVTSRDRLITCPIFTGTETRPGHGIVSFICTVLTANGPVTATVTNVPSQVNISH